jgi:hypothetical protein
MLFRDFVPHWCVPEQKVSDIYWTLRPLDYAPLGLCASMRNLDDA